MNRTDFQALADMRLEEAKILHSAGKHSGAYYISGYTIECALKACIAHAIRPDEWPEPGFSKSLYTHDLEELLGLAGLKQKLEQDIGADPILGGKWGSVTKWNERKRYDRSITAVEAADLIEAIENPQKGILPWIESQPQW